MIDIPDMEPMEIEEDEIQEEEYTFEGDQTVTSHNQSLLDFDPEDIDYSVDCPMAIQTEEQALIILKHLKGEDLGTAEQVYYETLMQLFDIEEADDTVLSREEKMLIAGDFGQFVKYMFLVEYGFKWKNNWHHDWLCNTLEDLFLGRLEVPRIIINIPPRYSKTQILIYFTAWSMGHAPDSKYIMLGYAKSLAEESSSQVREVLLNEKYQSIFNVELDKSSKKKDDFKTTARGGLFATSTGGSLTGKGAGKMRRSWGGCIIVDDPNNTTDSFSEVERDKKNKWLGNTLMSRRNNKKYTPIIVIQQRVHENDVSGYLLPTEDNPKGGVGEAFTHINVPAILTSAQLEEFNVPLDSDTRKYGNPETDEYPLWHDKITLEDLKEMEENLAVLAFYGQYMQQPYALDGSILKTKWIKERTAPSNAEIKYRVFVMDTAQTTNTRSDYSVIMVACVLMDGTVWIEDVYRGKLEAPKLADKVLEYFARYKPRKIYIEFKSSGIGLVQYLKTERVPLPIEEMARNAAGGDGDKITRAGGVASYIK